MTFHAPNNLDLILATALCCTIIALLIDRIVRKQDAGRPPFPPGPKGRVIIGNLADIPSAQPWVTFTGWQKAYGDLIHLQVLGQHVVIVNSVKVANDLFEKRSTIYSDRPVVPMIELMGWEFNMGLMPYSDRWRKHRRLFHQTFRPEASLAYRPVQLRKMYDLLQGLLSSPEDFMQHYKTLGAAVLMSIMYGHDMQPKDDQIVLIAEEATAKLSNSVFPGAAAVNAFPMLRHLPAWLPGAGFKHYALETRKLTADMQNAPLQAVKKQMETGTDTSSVVARLLAKNDAQGGPGISEEEDFIKQVAATAYATGADTTASTIASFFLAMCINPEAQRKAQEEIDTVIGPHRLPDFEDRANLPYVEAMYRELMRWRPAVPLGVAHASMADDIYNDYFIPKGATVIANLWAMTHNDKFYTNPDVFIPERFFNADGQLNDDHDPVAFGFGRRICVGRHLASSTVWAVIASVLATFNIAKAKDSAGKEIEIGAQYTDGLVSHPLPFQCSITPRSAEARELILNAATRE